MSDDVELLRRYAEQREEDAFAELVRRRLKLVYSVALRQCGGDPELAAEVTQRVFTDLARKAAALSGRAVLSGWLYRSARFAASDAVRAQRRRRAHELEASIMKEIPEDPRDAEWRELRPVLDEVLSELGDHDRDAVMLRFFEGWPFPEIGAALRLSEDAARMRVDRALERMRRMLTRRGVTSTAGALGLALANQAGAAPPAGLAASVTTSALGGAALLGFMSTAKMTSGVMGVAALLAISVATNVWFVTRSRGALSAEMSRRPVAAPPAPAAAGVPLAALTDDPLQLRDQLRATGLSLALTRALVEGMLRRQYREALSALRAERARNGWWREAWAGQMDRPPPMNDDYRLMQNIVFDPLERLFGPEPSAQAEYEARFEFLPAEKRAAVIALEREFDRALALRTGDENGSPEVLAVAAREEKRRLLLATLTPEERAEYELRRTMAGGRTAERMGQIDATEAEFRAIMGIVNPGDAVSRTDAAARAARDDRMMQQLVGALGFDRAADYIWSATPEYAAYTRIAEKEQLPRGTAGQVVQLAAETADRAIAISRDSALDAAQKRAALLDLQQTVRPRLDALVPPAAQARMATEPLEWFTALGTGRYRTVTAALNSNEGVARMIGTIAVDTPWSTHAPVPPVPRRPGL